VSGPKRRRPPPSRIGKRPKKSSSDGEHSTLADVDAEMARLEADSTLGPLRRQAALETLERKRFALREANAG